MANDKQRSTLRRLAQLDVDAILAYESAIQHCVPQVAQTLSEFRLDHLRHLQDLNEWIVKWGDKPVEQTPDLKGLGLKAFTAVTSMLGTEAALLAMIGNEELTTHRYQWALRADFEPEVRALVEKNYGDERRHLDWCKHTFRERLRGRREQAQT